MNNLMMLLPLIMGNKGGISPDALMGMLSNSQNNNVNPMMAMIMAMISQKKEQKPNTNVSEKENGKTPPNDIFGQDVANMLKLFMEMNGKKTEPNA